MIQQKCVIEKADKSINGYKYNVQIWASVDGGKNYYYCGIGRFCKTKKECEEFIRIYKKEHGSAE